MKKIILSLVVFVVFISISLTNVAQAAYESITSDYKIQKALMVLDAHGEGATVRTLVRKNIQIKFTDLAMMSPAYMRYNALAAKDRRNNQYIFIDNKHKSAPVEALAALLAHEATHQNVVYGASIDEVSATWEDVSSSEPPRGDGSTDGVSSCGADGSAAGDGAGSGWAATSSAGAAAADMARISDSSPLISSACSDRVASGSGSAAGCDASGSLPSTTGSRWAYGSFTCSFNPRSGANTTR